MPELNALGIVTSDMARSITFYRLLVLDVPETRTRATPTRFCPNGVRFMLDSEETVRSFKPDWTRATGNQVGLALECASPAEVDDVYARAVAAGFDGDKAPWDAFWGQRYAQLRDPDGVPVDLYASFRSAAPEGGGTCANLSRSRTDLDAFRRAACSAQRSAGPARRILFA